MRVYTRYQLYLRSFLAILFSLLAIDAVANETAESNVTVTILATNVGDIHGHDNAIATTQGEWSFAAWIEVGERVFLFDTGWSPNNVAHNAEVLGIDLSRAEDLILSHHHGDHTGGLETLRKELSQSNPKALSRIHVAEGIFASRPGPNNTERNPMVARKEALEALGSTFITYAQTTEIAPKVWVTGPVPRKHPEKNYPQHKASVVQVNCSTVHDTIPESQSLVIVTPEGPVVISGCGHAGLINTLEYIQAKISDQSPQAAIGGFHLFAATDDTLEWTGEALGKMKLGHFLGSHCTGFECVYRVRQHAGLGRNQARVGAIGTRFVSGQGITPGNINR